MNEERKIIIKEKEHYIKDFELAKKANKTLKIIQYLYTFRFPDEKQSEKNILKLLEDWKTFEMMIKGKKVDKKFPKYIKMKLYNYFQDINNKEVLLEIFNQEDIDYFINNTKNYANKTMRNPYNLKYDSDINTTEKPKKKIIEEKGQKRKKIIDNIIESKQIAFIFLENESCFKFSKNNQFKEPILISSNGINFTYEESINNFNLIKEEENSILIKNHIKISEHLKLFKEKMKNYIDKLDEIILKFKKKDKNCFNGYFNFECNYLVKINEKYVEFEFKDINIFINGINKGISDMAYYINSFDRPNFEGITREHTITNTKIGENLTFDESNDYFKNQNITISNVWINYYNNDDEYLIFKANDRYYKHTTDTTKNNDDFIELKLKELVIKSEKIKKHYIMKNKNIILNINDNKKEIGKESEWINFEAIDKNDIIAFIINDESHSEKGKILYLYDKNKDKILSKYNFKSSSKNNIFLFNKDEKNNSILIIPRKNENKNEIVLIDIAKLNENQEEENFPSFPTNEFEIFTLCPIMVGKDSNSKFNQSTQYFYAYGYDGFDNKMKILLYHFYFDYNLEKNQIILVNEVKAKTKTDNSTEEKILFLIQSEKNGKILIIYENGSFSSFSPPS